MIYDGNPDPWQRFLVNGIKPFVSCWEKPITIARHAYGDVYRDTEFLVDGPARADLVITYPDGRQESQTIFEYKDAGVVQGLYNTDKSISAFATSCFEYALDTKQDLWFATKDTISKKYDGRFKEIFQNIYDTQYKEKFEACGITYFYTLIDDAVARVMRSKGGFVWALKNYDGDVMSDMLASACGSLAMMTSVLVSPKGVYEYEAAHGTVTRHYYRHLNGEQTSTNPMATLFAWSGALRKRAQLDNLPELEAFADKIEKASIETIEEGTITGDLNNLLDNENKKTVTTEEFLKAVAAKL